MIKLGNKSYDKLGCHLVRLTLLLSVLILYFVMGSVVGIEDFNYIFLIKSITYRQPQRNIMEHYIAYHHSTLFIVVSHALIRYGLISGQVS